MYGAAVPKAPGGTAIASGRSAANEAKSACSLLPSCFMLAIRILAVLQTGQIPVGGMTQSMRSLHPQLQLSFPAIRTTSGLSYSFAVCARLKTVANAISRLAFHFFTFPRNLHDFHTREHQLGLARNQADDRARKNHPVTDPDPAHQRIHIRLDDLVLAVARPGVVQIQIFVQATSQGDFMGRRLR